MHADIAAKRDGLIALCRRFDVERLEVFGSAARGTDFEPHRSDADFLVAYKAESTQQPLAQFLGLAQALEELLGRPVDLLERKALEHSRNDIRRRSILKDATVVYG